MTTNQQDKSCDECSSLNCPHMTAKMYTLTIESSDSYNPILCNSYDHKIPILQIQGIHFGMMRYFGGSDTSVSLLCEGWLEARGEVEPLDSWGDYMMYRKGYKFD